MTINSITQIKLKYVMCATIVAIIAIWATGSVNAQTKTKCKPGSRSAKCLQTKPNVKMPAAAQQKIVTNTTETLAVSEWADAGIQLSVFGDKTEIVFNCANGEISGAFGHSATGDFNLAGTYTPVLADTKNRLAAGVEVQAWYTGKISGDEMTLKITSADGRVIYAEHKLSKDTIARIRRCG